jgi:carbonic anhydrase
MTDAVTFQVVFAVFSVVVVIVVLLFARKARKLERERALGLKSSAALLGWQFAEEAPLSYLPNLDNFALFRQGHNKQIKNMMYGETNGVKAALFDYIYVTGSGKSRQTHYQSVAYFEPHHLNLPFFSLRPENALHKLIAMFGYQDIDFGKHPTFSSKYLLRGANEQAIRNVFDDALLAFYETNPGLSTDGGENQLFIFRQGFRSPPHEAQSFISWAAQVQNAFPRVV